MLIELNSAAISYKKNTPVLDRIQLAVRSGEFIGIVGRAGSGKTTLLEIIAGMHKPDSGHVLFEGKDIYEKGFNNHNFRKKVQIVFQFPENQFFETNVFQEAAFGPRMLGFSENEIQRCVTDALLSVGLDLNEIGGKSPFILSGGQKRRLAVASALTVKPEVLLLDEPFSGLDAEGKKILSRTLHDLHSHGMTILMVSHDPDILYDLADRIIVISEGKIAKDDNPKSVYSETSFCRKNGIGQPDIIRLADLLNIKNDSYDNYTQFLQEIHDLIKVKNA